MIAVPSILQQSFVSVGNIIIQRVVNEFGFSVMAGYSAAVKLNTLVTTSFITISNGISNFSAQNLGARKYGRIREGFGAGLKMVWCLCIPFCLLYMAFGKYFLLMFMEEESVEALQTGRQFLWIVSPFYFAIAMKFIADGVLRGVSAMRQFMVATFSDLFLRIILAAVFSAWTNSALGIWFAWPVGWVVSTVLSLIFYRKKFREVSAA